MTHMCEYRGVIRARICVELNITLNLERFLLRYYDIANVRFTVVIIPRVIFIESVTYWSNSLWERYAKM